ncbi:helix-turn-helix domain-containing protein [Streptomyces sp. M19]
MSELPIIRTLTDLRIHYADSARIPAALMPAVRAVVRERYDQGAPVRRIAAEAGRSYGWAHRAVTASGATFRGWGGPVPPARSPRKAPWMSCFTPTTHVSCPGPTTTGSPATSNPAVRAGTCGNVPTSSRPPCSPTALRSWPTPAPTAHHHITEPELRGMARRLVESLASALLVAESRGRRL